MLLRRGIPAGDRGFTLVEVMVAVALLLIGALGVITMVTGANAQTAVTKGREGATNLAREIIDAARGVDYQSDLTPAAITPALQAQPALVDSDPGTPGWQIQRRGITYTVASLPICIIDAAADRYGAHPASNDPAGLNYCSGQQTDNKDPNPDDFRRMDVTLTWTVGAHPYSLRDTTLIINPSGGIGPTVKSLCRVASALAASCPATVMPSKETSATQMYFLALTSPADTTTWTVDDGTQPVDVSPSNLSAPTGTAWNYTWNLGTPAQPQAYTCGTTINWELDGNYIVTAQGVSGIGDNAVPGQLKPYTATLNRSDPYTVCGLVGGYNDPPSPTASHPVAVELEWRQNHERDIAGYQVWRTNADATKNLICDTTTITSYPYVGLGCTCTSQTSCLDTNPKPAPDNVVYRVTAVDTFGADTQDSLQAQIAVDENASESPPNDFGGTDVTLSSSNGLPQLNWPAATDPDGDPILYYRIYRNGTGYANRYDRVDGNTLSYVDEAPHAGGDTYYVSAVDSHYNESDPVQAVIP